MMRRNREIDARVPRVEDPPARDAPLSMTAQGWRLDHTASWPHVRIVRTWPCRTATNAGHGATARRP